MIQINLKKRIKSIEGITSFIFGCFGIYFLIDGIFFIPLKITRYGLTNIGIETSVFFY